jgi:hypothetical protein
MLNGSVPATLIIFRGDYIFNNIDHPYTNDSTEDAEPKD